MLECSATDPGVIGSTFGLGAKAVGVQAVKLFEGVSLNRDDSNWRFLAVLLNDHF